ncbi:calcium-binding protein [Gordonia sp. VNK21]|uniref:calcium-binding protein n=1 Tax=Gordonia sp. VNK21 TaxID=3382483 RepID=UPI0038D3EB96
MNSTTRTAVARTSGLAATAAVVGLALAGCSDSDSGDSADSSTSGTTGTTEHADYKNGEYTATGTYNSPGGLQKVGVTVTLDNNVVTALDLNHSYAKGTSATFQDKFASGIDALVVGKNIDDLDVSKVAGSSLTSAGFNEAIDEIKSQALS